MNSSSKHELCSQEAGDYKICFDNKFSYLSSKVVYFEILNVNEDEDYDDLAGIFDDEEKEEEYYDVQVSDIEASFHFIICPCRSLEIVFECVDVFRFS